MAKKALISVSDKDGLESFASALSKLGYEILSTGGTSKKIREAGIDVTEVGDYTGFPEIMEGRVKTLHPKIFGGILAIRDDEKHCEQAKENDIDFIDIIVVNLYPFEATIAKEGVTEEEAIEQIDIGGPSLLRAAAKNYQDAVVITDKNDYQQVIDQLESNGEVSIELKKELAKKVFKRTAEYDRTISNYLSQGEYLDLHYVKQSDLRYGENPHQEAAFYRNPNNNEANVTNAKVIQGKQLSFNNIVDADAAVELVKDFDQPTAVFIKHTNPCGVASSEDINESFKEAHQCDPQSAFGSVIALNRECTKEIAEYITNNKLFVEIIAAPSFASEALSIFEKRKNMRVLELGQLKKDEHRTDLKKVAGGILMQSKDTYVVSQDDLKTVSEKQPTQDEVEAMLFARNVVKHVKSNSVVFAKKLENGTIVTTGIGAGQMSRVDAVFIARNKGGDKIPGSCMASDAFFPFPDGVEEAHKAGVSGIIQPGGSIRDDEVIARVNELELSMLFTGIRSFKH